MGKRRGQRKKKNKTETTYADLYSDMDGTFAYIAGHTPGGAPYGVTWEEVGIDSYLPFVEKVQLYMKQMDESAGEVLEINGDDKLPFGYWQILK